MPVQTARVPLTRVTEIGATSIVLAQSAYQAVLDTGSPGEVGPLRFGELVFSMRAERVARRCAGAADSSGIPAA